LPCSVAVYEKSDGVYISAWLPDVIMPSTISNKELLELSKNLTNDIKLILDNIWLF